MTDYKWKGVEGEGPYLFRALKIEFARNRNYEFTVIGKAWQKEHDAEVMYWLSKEGDQEYKDYCDELGVGIPDKPYESPHCPNCHHKLQSRAEWSEQRSDYYYDCDWVKEVEQRFENIEDNVEVGKFFGIDPDPVEAYDDELGWIDYAEYVVKQI